MSALLTIVLTLAGALAGMTLLGARSARQCRKPAARAGELVLQRMNASHAGVTAWGLSHVQVADDATVLDVGCGGGQTIATLAALAAHGKVHGLDYSDQSVATASALNAGRIAAGQVEIRPGTVSALPYPDDTFDLVTAVETHYYWPDLPRDVREVRRVLKPGGQLLVVAETYRGRKNDWLYRPVMRFLLRATYLTPAQHRELLANAGFTDVREFVDAEHGWVCVRGTKPE
ncbi:MAG TPA: class I SAM-dependent methyltransferase [Longimicrobiales bacterium]